jgi:hypothetical protein
MWMTTVRTDMTPRSRRDGVLVRRCGQRLVGQPALLQKPLVVSLCAIRVEVLEVGILTQGGVIHRLQFLPGDQLAEPSALDLGHVPDQAKQEQVGRRNCALRQLLTGQPGALAPQQGTMPGQEPDPGALTGG